MKPLTTVRVGGLALIKGAIAFMAVFAFLAARFDYPAILDGPANVVLPRLLATGSAGRAAWALYAFLPLIWIPAGVGAYRALRGSHPGAMLLALQCAVLAAIAMMLGLMRWPSIHWHLAQLQATANPDQQQVIAALFDGLNTYLGNYIGEFLGELSFNMFFLLSAWALLRSRAAPAGIASAGLVVAGMGFVGMLRNVTVAVAPVSAINNYLLPLWMIVFGVVLFRLPGPEMTQLNFGGVGVDFGATTLFSDVTFTVAAGERWGIVGRNGTGKTTLFRLVTGELEPTRGSIARAAGLRVSLLEQHRDFGGATTVWAAAAGGLADLLALEQSLEKQAAALAHDASPQALHRYGEDLERFEREGGYAVTSRIDTVLQGLEFDPAQARITPLSALSGGELGRIGLARQLMTTADVLLLDEPTNHLDLETTRWLEQYLTASERTVLLVSHDRAFLAGTVDHILHFEGDTATPYSAGYAAFVVQRAERRVAQQRAYEQQQRVVAHEQDYIARNIAGQNSKQAKGRRKRLESLPRLSPVVSADGTMALRFEVAERGGDQVLNAKDVSVGVASRTLVERFSGTLERTGVLGIIGPNGAGKSTLLRALLGEHPTLGGDLRLGASITVGYYRQDLSQVPLKKAVYDVIADMRPLWERGRIQGHLGRFGFSGKEVLRRADTLSGGERARLALAILMLSRANLLVLDEPTNHLDVESIEALEDAIQEYDGTVILVSHDRELLRALTTRIWVLHERRMTEFAGGFAEWEEVSTERAHAAAVRSAEDQALRQVHERQRVALHSKDGSDAKAKAGDDPRKALRRAQRELEQAEAAVAELESQVAPVVAALEDPALYTRHDGVVTAGKLGVELETLKRSLDKALERWTQATERMEQLGDGGRGKGDL